MARQAYHIIGAGVAGLSAAKFIKQKFPQATIYLYEAAHHIGGRAYSFVDKDWKLSLDNATHVLLKANQNACRVFHSFQKWQKIYFLGKGQTAPQPTKWKFRNEIAEAVFNTSFAEVGYKQWLNIAWQLFPFFPKQFLAAFSQGNLTKDLTQILQLPDIHINYGCKLLSIEQQGELISKLIFNQQSITLTENEQVISALDSYNYGKIFEPTHFEYNAIINIYFHTSMAITLPQGLHFIGLKGSLAQWVFSFPNILAVTISNANACSLSDEELARQIWAEICVLRGRAAAFMPEYRVLRHKRATIKQDKLNNALRPSSAQTKWANLQICGDWTMKNYPCCLESAILSAQRLKI